MTLKKIGDCLRFLSRLWWFEGNRDEAERYGCEAVDVMSEQPDSKFKAQVFSNISQLKMLSHQPHECMVWGHKAITMAKKLGDKETLSHALNNVGTVQMEMPELSLLLQAKIKAFETMELQRIIPAVVALLEYEWLSGDNVMEDSELESTIDLTKRMGNVYENGEFYFWLLKVESRSCRLNFSMTIIWPKIFRQLLH